MNKAEKAKIYRENNKEKIAAKKKEWRESNATKIKEYAKNYRFSNPEKIKELAKKQSHAKYKKSSKESCYQKWLQVLLSNCRLRHKKNNSNHITCEITLEDLLEKYEEQKGLCAISKVKLDHTQGSLNSISIDRIENTLGYTKENVHLVAKWINIGRRNATLDQIKRAIQDVIEANKVTVA